MKTATDRDLQDIANAINATACDVSVFLHELQCATVDNPHLSPIARVEIVLRLQRYMLAMQRQTQRDERLLTS